MSITRTITGGKDAVLSVIDERIAEYTLDEPSKAVMTKKSVAEFHYMVQGLKLARGIVEDTEDLNQARELGPDLAGWFSGLTGHRVDRITDLTSMDIGEIVDLIRVTPWPGVNRFEVIDETGRVYSRWECKITPMLQDGERTLKIIVAEGD